MSGHGELFSTAHAARLDKDDISACGCPDQSDRNAGLFDAIFDFAFGAEFWNPERLVHHFGRDDEFIRLAFGDAPRLFPDQGGDFAFEIPDAGFTRVAMNDLAQSVVGELDLLAHLQTM